MKKNDVIISNQNSNILPDPFDAINTAMQEVVTKANKKIEEGLSKPTASTGTPISELHGLPKKIAQKSNIGGGSKATGGSGYEGGEKIINIRDTAETVMKTINMMQDNNLPSN